MLRFISVARPLSADELTSDCGLVGTSGTIAPVVRTFKRWAQRIPAIAEKVRSGK